VYFWSINAKLEGCTVKAMSSHYEEFYATNNRTVLMSFL